MFNFVVNDNNIDSPLQGIMKFEFLTIFLLFQKNLAMVMHLIYIVLGKQNFKSTRGQSRCQKVGETNNLQQRRRDKKGKVKKRHKLIHISIQTVHEETISCSRCRV